jgi:hypothetical protein
LQATTIDHKQETTNSKHHTRIQPTTATIFNSQQPQPLKQHSLSDFVSHFISVFFLFHIMRKILFGIFINNH